MLHRNFILIGALTLTMTVGAQQTSTLRFDGSSWWNYVKVLADDNMEGRDTGSDGLRRAEAYTVEQLKKSGLEPAGENGFYQTVKFDQRQVDEKSLLPLWFTPEIWSQSFSARTPTFPRPSTCLRRELQHLSYLSATV